MTRLPSLADSFCQQCHNGRMGCLPHVFFFITGVNSALLSHVMVNAYEGEAASTAGP